MSEPTEKERTNGNVQVAARLQAKRTFFDIAKNHQFRTRTVSGWEPGKTITCGMCGGKFIPASFGEGDLHDVCPNLANAAKTCMLLGCTDMELAMIWHGHGLPK